MGCDKHLIKTGQISKSFVSLVLNQLIIKTVEGMKTGIIYSRVSTDRQETDRQQNELLTYAKNNGIEVVQIFEDTTSGKTAAKNRTAAKQMFAYIEAERVDIVLVSEISRLGRSAIDVQKNIDTIVFQLNKELYIFQQSLSSHTKAGKVNSTFKLITDVLCNVAQMETEILSERIKSGLKEAKRKGKTLGRKVGSVKSSATLLKEYKQVVKQLNQGQSIRNTAKICGVSKATVSKVKAAIKAAKTVQTIQPKNELKGQRKLSL